MAKISQDKYTYLNLVGKCVERGEVVRTEEEVIGGLVMIL